MGFNNNYSECFDKFMPAISELFLYRAGNSWRSQKTYKDMYRYLANVSTWSLVVGRGSILS